MSVLNSLPSCIISKPDARGVLVPSYIGGVIQRCLDLLQVYVRNIPSTTTCNANSVHEFSENVLPFRLCRDLQGKKIDRVKRSAGWYGENRHKPLLNTKSHRVSVLKQTPQLMEACLV